MAISFTANRVQQASYLMLHLHKSRGEFGIKAIRYVSYCYAVASKIAICFSANRVQRASYPMPHSHKSRGEFEIRSIRYINYRYAEVGESAIRFLSNCVQKKHRFLSQVHVKTCILHPQDA